jgi:uncharacterized protein YukE
MTMNMSLISDGVGTLSLSGLATTSTVGGNTTVVSNATSSLRDYATNMQTFADSLLSKEDDILNGWTGTAPEVLRSNFPGLIETFKQLKPCLESIADWADETMKAYSTEDDETASAIRAILGGTQ